MNEKEIFIELEDLANDLLRKNQIILTERLTANFFSSLKSASSKMVKEKRVSQKDIDLAKKRLNLLINEFSNFKHREVRGNYQIDMDSYSKTLRGICPLWPFC